jgi:hypothetical protein
MLEFEKIISNNMCQWGVEIVTVVRVLFLAERKHIF